MRRFLFLFIFFSPNEQRRKRDQSERRRNTWIFEGKGLTRNEADEDDQIGRQTDRQTDKTMHRIRTSRKARRGEEELRAFSLRMPVYLFLLWLTSALHTLDGFFVSFSVSLFHTDQHQQQNKKTQQGKDEDDVEEKFREKCTTKNTEGIVLLSLSFSSSSSADCVASVQYKNEE